MTVNFEINLTKTQKEAIRALGNPNVSLLLCRVSRQAGKTVLAEMCLIRHLLRANKFSAYISPTFSQGRKVYQEIVQLLDGTGLIAKANASELTIESTVGGKLQFFTMQSPNAIRGYTVTGLLVLDEAAFFPNVLPDGSDWWGNVVLPITKAKHPKILIISTPNGKQGKFYELCMMAEAGHKGYQEIVSDIYEDDLITPEEIEEIRSTISPLAFRQEFLCEFLDSALTVFPSFEECFNGHYSGGDCWIGIDVSTVGSDDTILTVINKKNEVRQHKVTGTLDSRYAQLAKLINEYNPIHTYMESNSIGEPVANEVRKLLKNKQKFSTFSTTNQTKQDYVSLIAVAVANKNISFEVENKLLYSQMGTFTYTLTKTGKVTYAAKAGLHDDAVISLGISLQCKEDYKMNQAFSFPNQRPLFIN